MQAEQEAKARKAEKERRKLMGGKEAAVSSENGASISVPAHHPDGRTPFRLATARSCAQPFPTIHKQDT